MADNSFKIKNSLVLTPVDLTTLTNPQAGDLACDSNDSNKIKRYDANSSAWTEVGSGGVGSVDIMFVQDFESASLTTFVSPTDVTLSTTDPLHGKVSALLTHDASVNKSFKQIIPVDRKFRGQAMVLDLNVKSAASAGNVVIKVRDESNSSDLIVSEALQLSNDVSGRRSSVSFTIPSTCASLSYTITALPEAGSSVTRIDDIVAMLSDVSLLETSVEVPNMTAWQSYIPTFQGFGTPTAIQFQWRQSGENVEIRGKFTSGLPTTAEARIGLPAGLSSAGVDKIPSIQEIGEMSSSTTATIDYSVLVQPSVFYLNIGTQGGTQGGLTPKLGTDVIGNGESLSFFASVPCAGLSATSTKTIPLTQSGLVQEGDSIVRLSNTTSLGTTATTIPRFINTQQNIGSAILYQDSPVNGASFTALETGVYSFSFCFEGPTTNYHIGLTKNQAVLTQSITVVSESERLVAVRQSTTNTTTEAAWTGLLNAGDIVRPNLSVSTIPANPSFCNFTASYQGSLKQVSVSSDQKITIPTSELRFEGASARGTGTETGIVQFSSLAKLRGDAFTVSNSNGTAITMTKAGLLSISTSLYNSTAMFVYITKNQATRTSNPIISEVLSANGASASAPASAVAWIGKVAVGDIIRIYSTATPTSDPLNNLNLSFQEQDISVSVTNTLPQFSESDTSLRLSGANGYGSTATTTRRFSSVLQNIGTDVQYVDSPTLGGQFTALASGIYNISYTEESTANSAESFAAIRVNGIAVSYDSVVLNSASTATKSPGTSWQGYLSQGDIVTATVSTAANNNGAGCVFTISKVGKPNVTGVDVTPFVNVPQPEVASYSVINSPNGFGSTYTQTPRFSSIQQNDGKGILSYTDSPTLGAYWTANKKCIATISLNSIYLAAAAWSFRIFKNQTGVNTGTGLTTIDDQANTRAGGTISVELNVGDRISFYYSSTSMNRTEEHVFITATALSDQILTAPETFSTDTASLSYASSAAYTLSTLQNAPVGTYITFTYAANTNTRTQTTTRPTQTDADMNANGMLIYPRAYNVSSSAAQPAVFAIQIGKGMKGISKSLYRDPGKLLTFFTDRIISQTFAEGLNVDYDEKQGILIADAGFSPSAVTTAVFKQNQILTDVSNTSGYLVINASKNPALTGLGLQTVAARGVSTSGQSIPNTGDNIMLYDSIKTYDTHNALNTTTGVFTAPETGYYQATWSCFFSMTSNIGQVVTSFLYKNGVSYAAGAYNTLDRAVSIDAGSTGACGIYLVKGDTVDIRIYNNRAAGATNLNTTARYNFFSIHKTSIGTGN